jgi:Uma2 family endonuclease
MSILHSAERLSVDGFLALPLSHEPIELVAGEIIVTPRPSSKHQEIVLYIAHELRIRIGRQGRLIHDKETIVSRAPEAPTIRAPDLLYVRESRREIVTPRAIEGPPYLVIEVLSESAEETDRIAKRDEYRACGVPEYWIVDVANRAILVHDFRAGTQTLYRDHASFRCPVLSELGLPSDFRVSDFFSVLD